VGTPFAVFALICIVTFVSSRKRPGETPVSILSERIGEALSRLNPRRESKSGAEA